MDIAATDTITTLTKVQDTGTNTGMIIFPIHYTNFSYLSDLYQEKNDDFHYFSSGNAAQ